MKTEKPGFLFLCGFMGVGKSTVGILLAEKLKVHFYDTDKLVTEKTGQTVAEIFDNEGESAFRSYEQTVLSNFENTHGSAVIALGGGILNNPENLSFVLRKGMLIQLAASVETLDVRLETSGFSRPLLANLTREARKEKIAQLLAERLPIYEKASLRIVTDHKQPDVIASEIFTRITEKAS